MNGADFTGSTPLTIGATVSETQKSLNFFVPNMYYTHTDKSRGVRVDSPWLTDSHF